MITITILLRKGIRDRIPIIPKSQITSSKQNICINEPPSLAPPKMMHNQKVIEISKSYTSLKNDINANQKLFQSFQYDSEKYQQELNQIKNNQYKIFQEIINLKKHIKDNEQEIIPKLEEQIKSLKSELAQKENKILGLEARLSNIEENFVKKYLYQK